MNKEQRDRDDRLVRGEEEETEPQTKSTYLKGLLLKTVMKLEHLTRMGYAIYCTWEENWDKKYYAKSFYDIIIEREIPAFTRRYRKTPVNSRKDFVMKNLCDPDGFANLIKSNENLTNCDSQKDMSLFGLAEVDIEPSGTENVDWTLDLFGPLFVSGLTKDGSERATLSGYKKVERCILTTPYIRDLLLVGMKVVKVHRVWEYSSMQCFKNFIDKAIDERKKGDQKNGNPILAETYKLVSQYNAMCIFVNLKI